MEVYGKIPPVTRTYSSRYLKYSIQYVVSSAGLRHYVGVAGTQACTTASCARRPDPLSSVAILPDPLRAERESARLEDDSINLLYGEFDQLGLAVDTELTLDVQAVGFNRSHAQFQRAGDLLVRFSLGNLLQYLSFARGQ